MKKIIVIAIALISMQGIAQQQGNNRANNPERGQKMNSLTAEEMAELQTKKMTLNLDLNASQQKEVYKLNLENAKQRKTMMETYQANKGSGTMGQPSKENRLKMANTRLDNQIAMKGKMKSILNADQYIKWEKLQQKMASREKGMRSKDAKNNGGRKQKQG